MFQQTRGSTTLYLGNQIPHSTWSAFRFRLSRRHSGLKWVHRENLPARPAKPIPVARITGEFPKKSGTKIGLWWLWQQQPHWLPSGSPCAMDFARFRKLSADKNVLRSGESARFLNASLFHRLKQGIDLERIWKFRYSVVQWASREAMRSYWSCHWKVCRLSSDHQYIPYTQQVHWNVSIQWAQYAQWWHSFSFAAASSHITKLIETPSITKATHSMAVLDSFRWENHH